MSEETMCGRSGLSSGTTRRPIGCVLLHELPIVAHHRAAGGGPAGGEGPRAVHAGSGTAARIRWCDALARRHGVRVGQTLATARARCAGIESAALDEGALARARREVIAALLELTPRIAPDGAHRFWVEPAPLAHRSGGSLDAFREATRERLRPWGEARIGIGAWALLAYAAALHGDEAAADIDGCALDVLELDGDVRAALGALGVRRVGQLRELEPAALGMRLGPEVARARRRLDGDDPRGPSTPRLPDEPRVEVALEDPIDALEPLLFLVRPALATLLRDPVGRGHGVTELRLELRCLPSYGQERADRVSSARSAHPIADPSTLFELLRAMLDARDWELEGAIEGFALDAPRTSPLAERTEPLIGRPARAAATDVAVVRLRGRLGEDAVVQASHVETASTIERAEWTRERPRPGPALPWRSQDPPAPITQGTVDVAGRRRRVIRTGRVERALQPWWKTGAIRVERLAWIEVEGPLLVLARERRDLHPPRWEAVAWLD